MVILSNTASGRWTPAAAVLLVVLLTCPGTARAGEPRWQAGLEALTDFPVQLGGKVWVELPHRLRVSTSLGVLPGGYVDVINSFLVGVGAYNEATADVVRSSLESSLIWRVHAGWRPMSRRGFYFEIGYGLATLGGGLTAQDLICAMTGAAPPSGTSTGANYSVSSTLHMVDIELGWCWTLFRGLTLRAAVGAALTVGADTSVEPLAYQGSRLVKQFSAFSETYLDDIYTSYVFTPTLTVAVGWRVWPWL